MSGSILLATSIALRGATLIDGTGAPALPDSLLVVADGRIVSVGRATPTALEALPAGTAVLDVRGAWIISGLIDAHVHMESEADLRTMLARGVTSVRLMAEDTESAVRLARASDTRDDIPQVFPAAPIFTTKGGWWDQGQPPDAHLDRFPATPDAARESVRRAKALGTREIKIMLDDMAWCRAPKAPLPKLPLPVMEALVAEGRAQGLRVIVHAPNLADAKAAIAAGATALAHGVLDPFDADTLSAMKARPVFYVPTMDIFEFLADARSFVDGVLAAPGAAGGLPPAVVALYRSREYSDGYAERYANFESLRGRLPALRENLRKLRAAGVPIALGTDMWAFPGLAVSVEMELYVAAGLTPAEAVRAATATAARSIGVEADRGTLEAGKRADFLVLDGDPLADVANTRRIREIWKAGRRAGPSSPR